MLVNQETKKNSKMKQNGSCSHNNCKSVHPSTHLILVAATYGFICFFQCCLSSKTMHCYLYVFVILGETESWYVEPCACWCRVKWGPPKMGTWVSIFHVILKVINAGVGWVWLTRLGWTHVHYPGCASKISDTRSGL